MNKCLIAGSFDPITKGHEDIIKRASKLFSEVHVVIFENIAKKYTFTKQQRVDFIKATFSGQNNVVVDVSSGLLTDYMNKNGINILVRGVRNQADFLYETTIEKINKKLFEEMECVYLSPSEGCDYISSSAVREVLIFSGDAKFLLPESTAEQIISAYKTNEKR